MPALLNHDRLRTQVPPHCIPIHANVTTYNWDALAAAAQFDVIMMDPPWALATANPSRGVSLGYRSAVMARWDAASQCHSRVLVCWISVTYGAFANTLAHAHSF